MVGNDPNVTDWISAFATVFAAVGTVGAVAVALWQINRQGRRHMVVQCRWAIVGELSGNVQVLTLRGTNDGARPIKVAMAYLMTDTGSQAVVRFAPYSNELPVVLQDGENVEISWTQSDLEQVRSKENCHYLYAFLMDVLGNVYPAPFPGVEAKRKGLRRPHTVYERSSSSAAIR